MRRAVGDAAGLTVKAQVRQAARNLDYPAEDWRVREAWYGRAGAWSATALDELRARAVAWREREVEQGAARALKRRLNAVREGLARLTREIEALDAQIDRMFVADSREADDA